MSGRWLQGLCMALLLAACQSPEAQGKTPQPAAGRSVTDVFAEDYVGAALPRARVVLKDAFGGQHVVDAEVAATPDSRARGLMWRKELAAGKGMLFIFPREEVQSFWMRNTLISLDLLFINSEGRIVGIVERAEPRTLTPRTVGEPGRYVLEVPGGWCQSKGITRGGTVEFHGLDGLQVVP